MSDWLSGLIREIPKKNYQQCVEIAVAKDTDNDHALCFKIFDSESSSRRKVVFSYHFYINWLEDIDASANTANVDWLGVVVAEALKMAYEQGSIDTQKATSDALSGLKSLLKSV